MIDRQLKLRRPEELTFEILAARIAAHSGDQLSHTRQTQHYLAGENTGECIREENGSYWYSESRHVITSEGNFTQVHEVKYRAITPERADELRRSKKTRVVIGKNRTIYGLHGTRINLDNVDLLGDFVEIRGESEHDIQEVRALLGLENAEVVAASYLDLMLNAKFSPLRVFVARCHDRIGAIVFGLYSGLYNCSGLIAGLALGSTSKRTLIKSILIFAFLDALADAMSMMEDEAAKRGSSAKDAIRKAGMTFLAKAIFSLTYLLFILPLPLGIGALASIAWSVTVVSLLSLENAYATDSALGPKIGVNLLKTSLAIVLGIVLSVLIDAMFPG